MTWRAEPTPRGVPIHQALYSWQPGSSGWSETRTDRHVAVPPGSDPTAALQQHLDRMVTATREAVYRPPNRPYELIREWAWGSEPGRTAQWRLVFQGDNYS